MKVRIGVSLGQAGVPDQFRAAVDALESAGVDSLWLPEMVYGSLVDPFIGMAHALARTSRLKVGTGVAVLPGRQPVLVAKQLPPWPAWPAAGAARVRPETGPARGTRRVPGAARPPGRGVRRYEDSTNCDSCQSLAMRRRRRLRPRKRARPLVGRPR